MGSGGAKSAGRSRSSRPAAFISAAPGRPITYGTTDAFLEHYSLASLLDLPGAAEMKAAGLLDLDLPADFAPPDPNRAAEDEDPLDPSDTPEFHQDYLGEAET